jgi:hypothetical protein
MNAIRHLRRLAGVLAGLAGVLLAFGATPAFAGILHSDPGGAAGYVGDPYLGIMGTGPVAPVPAATVRVINTGGMPGWQITLIALGAALLAATVAVLLDRARAAHHKTAPSAA